MEKKPEPVTRHKVFPSAALSVTLSLPQRCTRVCVNGARSLWRLLCRERRCMACASVYVPLSPDGPDIFFCPACTALLRRREQGYCPRCGEPEEDAEQPLALCPQCWQKPPPWKSMSFHNLHEGLLQHLLLQLKFHDQFILARPLALLLAAHPNLNGLRLDCVTPIPLHRKRLIERGYNQTLELARPLAVMLGLELLPGALERVKATAPQTGRGFKARQYNIRGAFAGTPEAQGKRILLLDDTVTTGATLAVAAEALLAAGAEEVHTAAISRTSRFKGKLS